MVEINFYKKINFQNNFYSKIMLYVSFNNANNVEILVLSGFYK